MADDLNEMNSAFYSQTGEDGILAGIFEGKTSGTCLEVGALDGIKDSTTLHFEKKGWSCILVEANPDLAERAKANRRAVVFSCAAGRRSGATELLIARGAEYLSTMIGTEERISRIRRGGGKIERIDVPVRRVDDLLQEAGVSRLDFATVDVEGAELEVLQGFDLQRWSPRVLVLEDGSEGHDRRARRHLNSEGYRCFLSDGLNDWYARKSDHHLLTLSRRVRQWRRGIRIRLYEWSVGLLPVALQEKLVRWKRRWLGKL